MSVRVLNAQTEAGSPTMLVLSEVEAIPTIELVFALITLASDDDAVAISLSVFAFTDAATEDDAVPIAVTTVDVALSTSERVASEPDVSPAPVRVRVAEPQTSDARVPNDVSVLPLKAQILAGKVAARDEEAVAISLSVFAFTLEATEEEAVETSESVASEPESSSGPESRLVATPQTSVASVPNPVRVRVLNAHTDAGMPRMLELSEVEAIPTMLFVLVLMILASELVAIAILLSVFALTAAVTELDAAVICEPVVVVALSISLLVASDPEVRPAPVSVRVP